jgi:hypothetical protein
LNPRVRTDTSFPGWLPTELGDPGSIKYRGIGDLNPTRSSTGDVFKSEGGSSYAMEALNVNWVERSEKTLEELKKLKEKKDQDRLDRVRAMRFAFLALGQSLAGWMQWVNSPEVMSNFTKEELEEMSQTILRMVEKFVEYDIEITNEGMQKGVAKQREQEKQDNHFVI